jgi:hypothetical protein
MRSKPACTEPGRPVNGALISIRVSMTLLADSPPAVVAANLSPDPMLGEPNG